MNTQETMTSNLLSWDDVSKVPFPDEVKEIASATDWNDAIWETIGLPIHLAKYSIVGGQSLYLDEMPDGESKVTKQEITDAIQATALLIDNNGDTNYIVTFQLIFVSGELVNVKHLTTKPMNRKAYEAKFADFQKRHRIQNAWWYKWVYIPYSILVKVLFFLPLALLNLSRIILVTLLKMLTPL